MWVAADRNAEGQYTQANTSTGLTVKRTFNAQTGRVTAITAGPGSLASVANLTFSYDTLGNLASRGDVIQGVTENFTYDELNRLKTSTIVGVGAKQVSYNVAGSIAQKTRLGTSLPNTYTYPTAGLSRPYAVTSVAGTVNGVLNPTYSYDSNGNLTAGAGRTYTWTSFNMAETVTQGATSVSYLYDAQHQRVKQTDGSTTVKYFNDPISGVSAEHDSTAGGTWHDYLFVDGERVGLRIAPPSPATASWQMYVSDYQGSIAVVTDALGAVVQSMSYDAWGRARQPDGTEDPGGAITRPTSRGYTGHEHLPGVSLVNMNGRMYDPEVGQFLSPDPVTSNVYKPQALNKNSYVYNNPLYYTDPTGFSAWTKIRDRVVKPLAAVAVAVYIGIPVFDAVSEYATFGGGAVGSFASSALAGIASGFLVGGITGGIYSGPQGILQGMELGAIGGAVTGGLSSFLEPAKDAWTAGRLVTSAVIDGIATVAQGGTFAQGIVGMFQGMGYRYAFSSFVQPMANSLGEKTKGTWNPQTAWEDANQIAQEELERSQDLALTLGASAHNDILDAERHARWVYRMANEVGPGWARIFSYGHEFQEELVIVFRRAQPLNEFLMDIHNNAIGLKSALSGAPIPDINTPGLIYITPGGDYYAH
jgi:RHS repeat-associated protein